MAAGAGVGLTAQVGTSQQVKSGTTGAGHDALTAELRGQQHSLLRGSAYLQLGSQQKPLWLAQCACSREASKVHAQRRQSLCFCGSVG